MSCSGDDVPMKEVSIQMVKLVSQDEKTFNVPRDILKLSTTLDTLINDLVPDVCDTAIEVPVAKVKGDILERVIKWCTHHKDDGPVKEMTNEEKKGMVIPDWDQQFFMCSAGVLVGVVEAANYLEIPGLLRLSCKCIADMLKARSTEEIRYQFNLKDDFTDEERIEVAKEKEMFETNSIE